MLYCKKCKVSVAGDKKCCPLCRESLSGEADAATEVFPIPEMPKYSKNFLLKLITFIAIAGALINVGIDYSVPNENNVRWSILVVFGIICLWISTAIVITRRRNVLKIISWQLFLLTVFSVFWDYFTGWHGWSLDYVIPFCCIASITCMYILSLVLKINSRGFVSYMIFDAIYGIIPIIFILTDSLNVTYPSVACVIYNLISVAAIIIFKRRLFVEELKRKFHV